MPKYNNPRKTWRYADYFKRKEYREGKIKSDGLCYIWRMGIWQVDSMNKARMVWLLLPLAVLARAERMPWETDEYKQGVVERVGGVLSTMPIEDLVIVGVIHSGGGEGKAALVKIPDGQILLVPAGSRIGLNQGVVSNIEDASIRIIESVPVCGTPDFVQRTLEISVPGSASAGTTIRYQEEGGDNFCD